MLKVQKKINSWGCLPTSFAIVLGIDVKELYEKIGHDGGEIIDGGKEPYCRRGVHTQEVIDVCLGMGYAVTQIDCLPALKRKNSETPIYADDENEARVLKHLGNSAGVIVGSSISNIFKRHALVNNFGDIYDPDTGGKLDNLPHIYAYENYYRVDKICETEIPKV